MTIPTTLLLLVLSFHPAKDDSLKGTMWTRQVTPECVDTLELLSLNNSYYYRCEMDYTNEVKYSISADTLFLDEYDFVSLIDTTKGKEVLSKLKLIIKNDKLKPIYIAHKYSESFIEVDKKIYESVGEFIRMK